MKKLMLILSSILLILALQPLSASLFRTISLGGIVPDIETDVWMNPGLLTRLEGSRLSVNPGFYFYNNLTEEEDYLFINPPLATNNTRTVATRSWGFQGSYLTYLYNKGTFGFGFTLTPNSTSRLETTTIDPDISTNDPFDVVETDSESSGVPYNASLALGYSLGNLSLGMTGSFESSPELSEHSETTNGIEDPTMRTLTIKSKNEYSGSLAFTYSDDKIYLIGLDLGGKYGRFSDRSDSFDWLMIGNYVPLSNNHLIEKQGTLFAIEGSFLNELKKGDNGLIRLLFSFTYEAESSEYVGTDFGIGMAPGITNMSVTETVSKIIPNLGLSLCNNFDRTVTAMGFLFAMDKSSTTLIYDEDTTTNEKLLNKYYEDTSTILSLNADMVFSAETVALPWLVLRGSIIPTLFSYSSTANQKADGYDPVKDRMAAYVTDKDTDSTWRLLPRIMFIPGVAFRPTPNMSIDLIAIMEFVDMSYSSSNNAWAEERPLLDDTKFSPVDTTKRFNMSLNFSFNMKF